MKFQFVNHTACKKKHAYSNNILDPENDLFSVAANMRQKYTNLFLAAKTRCRK
jgi:hypothetical protein